MAWVPAVLQSIARAYDVCQKITVSRDSKRVELKEAS